ncbi:MAG: CZB domain-containing protein [Magnetococcales bacterium]|nr:CZB domain-containing protein [Magnetococcales bacterium]
MKQVDLGIARIAHLVWESELEEMVQQKRPSMHLQSHEECELGLWLHGEINYEMGHLASVKHLLAVHQQFHVAALRVIEYLKHGPSATVAREMQKVRELSRDIVYFITEIEIDSLEQKPLSHFSTHPLKNMIYRFFHVSNEPPTEGHGILEVSYARLEHLRWSRDLLRSFHHWGREADLISSRQCAVGKWIQQIGLPSGQHTELVKDLQQIHESFHAKAEDTLHLLRRKNITGSENAYREVVRLGREVLYLLTRIELAFLQSGSIATPTNFIKM